MTCAEALNAMLECDPRELDSQVPSELAAHVAGCGRCRAVAGTLTRGILVARSGTLAARRRRRSRSRVGAAIGIASLPIAAALALAVHSRQDDVHVEKALAPPAAIVPIADRAAAGSSAGRGESPTAPSPATAPRSSVRSSATTPSIASASIAGLPPVLPTVEEQLPESLTTVRVVSSNGRGYAVINTADPRITVVLYY